MRIRITLEWWSLGGRWMVHKVNRYDDSFGLNVHGYMVQLKYLFIEIVKSSST